MSLLSPDLRKLPPQALDVLRYLGTQEEHAPIHDILEGTGLSERGFGKAIRRLVTRYYVEMPTQGVYTLTKIGRQAATDLRIYDGAEPPAEDFAASLPAEALCHARQLSVMAPRELVIRSAVVLRAGFSAPVDEQFPMKKPGRVILRLGVSGCDVAPVERPLEVALNASAGPVNFRVTPRREGKMRLKLEAFQLVTLRELVPVGGIYFDLNVSGFPSPLSGEIQTLGAMVYLHPGKDD